MRISGIPIGATKPRADWNQTDPGKADYILNKPDAVLYSTQKLDDTQKATARNNIGAADSIETKTAIATEKKELKKEISVERARINELVAMRGTNGTTEFTFFDEHISGTIKHNGICAYINVIVDGITLAPGGYYKTGYCIPRGLVPFNDVKLTSPHSEAAITLSAEIDEPPENADGGTYLLVEYRPSEPVENDAYFENVYGEANYVLAVPSISELEDIRIGDGLGGEPYPTAGDAVRGQYEIAYNLAQGLDFEVQDARIGVDGEPRETLGQAIREQVSMAHGAALEAQNEINQARFDADGTEYETLADSIQGQIAKASTGGGDNIICEATGNPIVLKDSSNRELQGLNLSNKNLFDESTMINADDWAVENGVYTGRNYYLRQLWIDQPPVNFAPNTQYYICFYGSSAVSGLNNRISVRYTDGTKADIYFNDLELTFKEFVTASGKSVKEIVLDYGSTGIISLSKFMICVASNNNAYAPYFSGGDVEVKVMGKNLWRLENVFVTQPSNNSIYVKLYDLPVGVPLTLSADITKYPDDTATNTRLFFGCYYTDGTSDKGYGVYDSANAERDGVARRKSATITINPNKAIDRIDCSLNDYSSQNGRNAKAENIQIEVGATATAFEPYKEPQTLTVSVPDGFGTDGFVCEDFAQLHTYKPNTTIINDVGAKMEVEYVADTKAYIDNKFNELATAIVALG